MVSLLVACLVFNYLNFYLAYMLLSPKVDEQNLLLLVLLLLVLLLLLSLLLLLLYKGSIWYDFNWFVFNHNFKSILPTFIFILNHFIFY